MSTLIVIAMILAVLVVGSALGQFWAPALLGLGFGGWGALLLLSGMGGIVPLVGMVFVGQGVVEFAAAYVLFGERDAGRRRDWCAGAALLGLVGSVGAVASLAWITAAITASLFI